ncbi:hypothetical protein GCM10022240_15510 [Microbacterium kribbense]|uniref:Uncharacterized protein n=1 Tax=Microbacterium kribbense TaxID=433645 RepID=A0ABP7GGQ3_9MICO
MRREGTTAMSSNVKARRARLARPSSMSMLTLTAYPRGSAAFRVSAGGWRAPCTGHAPATRPRAPVSDNRV